MALECGVQDSEWQQHSWWETAAQLPTNCPPLWCSVKDSEETNLCIFSWLKFYMEQKPQSSHQATKPVFVGFLGSKDAASQHLVLREKAPRLFKGKLNKSLFLQVLAILDSLLIPGRNIGSLFSSTSLHYSCEFRNGRWKIFMSWAVPIFYPILVESAWFSES